MSANRVIFVRHGQTDHNVQRRVQGSIDIPLNSTGIQQAADAAKALASWLADQCVTVISSPLIRAFATASSIATALGVQVVTDERLRERGFGRFEGMNAAELQHHYPEEYALWKSGGAPAGMEIEPTSAVGDRMSQAVNDHADRLDTHEVLLVVSHGSAITQTLRNLLGITDVPMPVIRGMDNCHWAEIQRGTFAAGPGWRLHTLNRPV
ncbi:MAG: histidine phosphatase family protein [Bowdeniella nasicola]|nr:histidine phosphatase family protein [Bowdeniella nasicola]